MDGWGAATSGVATDGTPVNDGMTGATVEVRTGLNVLYNVTATGGPARGTTLTQTVTLTPGTTYNVGFFYVRAMGRIGDSYTIIVDGIPLTLTRSDHVGGH